jgi:hypothetical protein
LELRIQHVDEVEKGGVFNKGQGYASVGNEGSKRVHELSRG